MHRSPPQASHGQPVSQPVVQTFEPIVCILYFIIFSNFHSLKLNHNNLIYKLIQKKKLQKKPKKLGVVGLYAINKKYS